jgi:predicted nicotinamide N-methyase
VGLLTTSGADPNVGDALCIGSAALFGVHKWRSETATARFADATSELIAVQLLVLASAAAAFSLPQLAAIASLGPGGLRCASFVYLSREMIYWAIF